MSKNRIIKDKPNNLWAKNKAVNKTYEEKKKRAGFREGGGDPLGLQNKTTNQNQQQKMAYNSLFYLLSFFLLAKFATSSSSISNDVFDAQSSFGRSLLQVKTPCNVSFQTMDYSVITDNCKGPKYPAKECCDAFKQFACQFADEINDLNTDCAATMFSYINLYGKYPPGLFANECKEGKEGLDCSKVEVTKSSASHFPASQSTSLMFIVGLLMLCLQLF